MLKSSEQHNIIKQVRAAYITSQGSHVFFNRDCVGIMLAKRCWTLGMIASQLHEDINDRHIGYEGYLGITKAIGKYTACRVAAKCGVLEQRKHEVGYATGSHVIMRIRRHHTNKLIQSQVACQAAATKMAVKFDLERAGQNVEAEIDSSTSLAPAWHRYWSMYVL